MPKELKLNLGSNEKRREGFTNVDVMNLPNVDIRWDLTNVPYPKKMEGASEILAMEVLEHISFWQTERVLTEWHRILRKGGKLRIQVPDIGLMCQYYVNNQVCDCVPHKAATYDGFKANKDCWNCKGKAKINTTRFLFAFCGAQKHQYDIHRNIFTKQMLERVLNRVGFKDVTFKPNIYKIVCECYK